MKKNSLIRRLCISSLSMTLTAAAGLYVMVIAVAEPMRSLAASSDSETAVVQVTLGAALGLSCDANGDNRVGSGETLSLGTITYTGDTGVYSNSRAVKCWVATNNQTGYTLGWEVASGSGGTATGHLVSQFNDIIQAFGTGSASNNTASWSVNSNDSRWGGRVSSTSSGSDVAPMLWGTDGSSEKWARVHTGSTLTIRASGVHAQSGSGDLIRIGFRAEVGATKAQPTGTYKATVTFTAATQ
ncbi:MAG TPA: hypothetical protein VHA78_01600 [Candidatus Peribacteraceae bacterium]|nr:hypothetical protein [Candidatus Peribacteraceae bacterium]